VAAVWLLGYGQLAGIFLAGRAEPVRPIADAAGPCRTAEPAAGKAPRPGRVYAVLAVVWTAFVVYGSLVPLEFKEVPFDQALQGFVQMRYFRLGVQHRADLVANLLLFAPLGFLGTAALTRGGTRGGRWLIAACVVAGSWALAAGIEFAQVYFPPRTVSLNDVLAECAGAVIGAGLWLALGGAVTRWFQDLREGRDPRRLAVHLLGGFAVVFFLYQLFPYDFVISKKELAVELMSPRVTFVPFTDPGGLSAAGLAIKAVALLPLGYLVVVAWSGWRRPVMAAAGLGLLFAGGIEALQVFIHSRYASGTDAVAGMVGAAAGGWLATRVGPGASRPFRKDALWRVTGALFRTGLLLGGMAAVLYVKWRPWQFRWPEEGLGPALAGLLHVPFYHQYWNSEFQATGQLVADVGSAAALGLLWGSLIGGFGRPGLAVAAAMAALFGAAAEGGQIFFAGHVPDLTTMVLAAGGGMAGALLYRRFAAIFIETPWEGQEPGGWLTT
jgi:VanZ family protein